MAKKKSKIIPNLKARRPSREEVPTALHGIAVEGSKRLGADVPVSIYLQFQERCRERGITKREYLLELLRRDGIG